MLEELTKNINWKVGYLSECQSPTLSSDNFSPSVSFIFSLEKSWYKFDVQMVGTYFDYIRQL